MLVIPPDPAGWKALLADPDKHWKRGCSAWELAHSWTNAGDGFPAEVAAAFRQVPDLEDLEPVLVIAEYQVTLAGRGHPSQNDAFVLAHGRNAGLAAITVEGKAGEDFGPRLSEWRRDASRGKKARERQLMKLLGLTKLPGDIRYQLVHRTASAVREAQRFRARHAVMLVQSFSPDDHFEDYAAFVGAFGAKAVRGRVGRLDGTGDRTLWAGWVDPATP